MKVKMSKNHMGYKKGKSYEVKDAMGRYWIGCGIATKLGKKTQQKQLKDSKETKELKNETETK